VEDTNGFSLGKSQRFFVPVEKLELISVDVSVEKLAVSFYHSSFRFFYDDYLIASLSGWLLVDCWLLVDWLSGFGCFTRS
jgi:hypothetical protein